MESQNGRGWKGPLWVTQSNPPQKQGHLEQAAEDLVQVGLEYLQRRRLHNLPGQSVLVLCHPQSEVGSPELDFFELLISCSHEQRSAYERRGTLIEVYESHCTHCVNSACVKKGHHLFFT